MTDFQQLRQEVLKARDAHRFAVEQLEARRRDFILEASSQPADSSKWAPVWQAVDKVIGSVILGAVKKSGETAGHVTIRLRDLNNVFERAVTWSEFHSERPVFQEILKRRYVRAAESNCYWLAGFPLVSNETHVLFHFVFN